jgi:hypothetical protein
MKHCSVCVRRARGAHAGSLAIAAVFFAPAAAGGTRLRTPFRTAGSKGGRPFKGRTLFNQPLKGAACGRAGADSCRVLRDVVRNEQSGAVTVLT